MEKRSGVLVGVGLAAAAAVVVYSLSSCRPEVTPSTQCGTESGSGCAPESQRVDLVLPPFSNPTQITNPLFPASEITQTLLLGNVDGHPLRVEYTLLPGRKTIEWNGRTIETRTVQYVAYLDRRLSEVALDWYAQADDGSVWYFGEDVSDYKDGVVETTEGSWLAGKDGPPAMIMPAHPKVGDVFRVENIPGIVFEEITVRRVGVSLDGPPGPIANGMVGDELHVDGSHSDKTFAPGYGEFLTERSGDIEAVSLAVPIDTLGGPVPTELVTLLGGAIRVFETANGEHWVALSALLDTLEGVWSRFRTRGTVPRLLDLQMTQALVAMAGTSLVPAIHDHNAGGARRAAIDLGQAALDLLLRHRPLVAIELARLDLWARQLQVDVDGEDPEAMVIGDVASLERIRDRMAHDLRAADAQQLDTLLSEARAAARDHELEDATVIAARVSALVKRLQP